MKDEMMAEDKTMKPAMDMEQEQAGGDSVAQAQSIMQSIVDQPEVCRELYALLKGKYEMEEKGEGEMMDTEGMSELED